MAEPLIKLQGVSFKYPNTELEENNFAVNNVSFEIERGDFVAILGHNGSGKSTTAKLINLILTADSGKIFIDGKDVDIEAEMVQAMEDLYCKHVPVRVREYIAKKSIPDSSKVSTSSSRK